MGRFTTFVIGALAGATVALAFAPNNGEKNRAFIVEKANAVMDEAKDFGAGFPGTAQDALNSVREQGTSLLKGAQDKGSDLVGDASSKVKGVAGKSSDADADELRAKIEAARQRIAAQVMENAEKSQAAAASAVETAAEVAEEAAEEAADKADEAKHAK